MSRASFGVATGRPSSSRMRRAFATCSALDFASCPRQPHAVLESHAHVAAHHRRHRRGEHLVAPRAEDRPVVRVAEQAIGGALHVQHVLGVRSDAAADAEHRLDEERRLEEPPLEEMCRGVEVPDVVALDLEARVVVGARLQDVGDVPERS